MRVTHKPGETMQVDWVGGTIPYFDPITGGEYKAYLFVAALPCSSYLYVEACTDMMMENWLLCHVHAYAYFGGVTRILVPDNLKTGVTANTRYETQLNESYQELAEYYGTAIVPARVRKPQDKGLVEKSVGFSTTWITAALCERKFFSIAEVQEAVAERLEYINTKPFQKRPGSRREAYLAEEKEFMLPLPKHPYEPSVWKQQTVGNDYLISDGLNKYSVPYQLGIAGILYNKEMTGDTEIDSWSDLWDEKFSDSIVMPDSVRDAFMIGLKKNGYSANSTNEDEIKAAADELIKQKPMVYKYANDSARDLLANGSAAIGVVWNGEYMYTKDLNENVEFVVPKEGSEFFIECDAVIMSLGTSPNPLIASTTDGLDINRRKCIVAQEDNGQTSKEGVFAGGDAVTGAATVILAMGAGKAAAKGIDKYLSGK